MSDEVAPAGASVLPEVDDVLADALGAQGEAGVRALGLLRDAHRVLAGSGFARPAEVAAACVRSAADALLGLPGAPVTVGLKPAAQGLLAAVDALARPTAEVLAPHGPVVLSGPAPSADEACPSDGPAAEAGSASIAADAAGGLSGASAEASTAWERVTAAADVLRDELNRPGRYHQARAQGIVERLMKVELGAAQETALDVWGTVYGVASGILHGRSAHPGEAAVLYADILAAARNLLVPLPGRAARVLELVAFQHPGAAEAKELAGWADPRAEAYFFRSGPATAWLGILQEHAPHLLMPDGAAGGRWPAAPFLDHVAAADPAAARAWLNAPADKGAPGVLRAQQIAATGRSALDALLGLAVRHWDAVDAAQLQAALAGPGVRDGDGVEVGATLRLAARWARAFPRAERTGQWIGAVEGLLAGAVQDEHTGHLALDAVAERVRAQMKAAGLLDGGDEDAAGAVADEAAGTDWVATEEEMRGLIALQVASRLPDHDVAMLVRELACTAYPAGRRGPAHRNVGAVRAVLAKLLAHDVELTPEQARPVVFHADLDQVRVGDSAAFGGPRLARAVLDVAAADADAGTGLAQRTRHFRRVAGLDARLHTRLMAAHLAHRPPAVGAVDGPEWWQQALALVPQALAADPDPEPARLVEFVLAACPPEHAAQLEADVRTALGTAPPAALVEEVLPAGTESADGHAEPLATWLRVWDWSPVLTSPLLQGWESLLQALRRREPAGPSDPRTQAVLEPSKTTTAVQAEDLAELAVGQGPVAAAARIAGAPDAGDDGYAMVLHRLVAADPAAWTTDVPAVLTALGRPELAAFYLAAAAAHADRPGAFPDDALPAAVAAALEVRRGLGERAPTVGFDGVRRWPAGVSFADQALFDLLTAAWRADALTGEQANDAVAYLQTLVASLTRRAGDTAPAAKTKDGTTTSTAPPAPDPAAAAAGTAGEGTTPALIGSDREVRALGCLLEYAVHQARTTGEMPEEVLNTVAGVLAAHAGQEAVATAIGVHLPALHRHAPAFAAAHRTALYGLVSGRPSPAASWLRWGGPDGQLLAALDRAELLAALRAGMPGAAEHLANALLDDPALLGEPPAWWAELADGTGDVAAVSRLLEAIAARTPHTGADGPLPPAEQVRVQAAVGLWRAALAAPGLPAGALAGAGAFADAAIGETAWLELMRASAEHSPALTDADLVVERAAAHPDRADALLLAAALVTQAPGTWREAAVRRNARALLDAAMALPQGERPCGVQELRTALVNVGDVDAATRR
ncbi:MULTISPECIES: hypothetical protein [Streptomyces]|uniref:Uncharacterized protein n=1 Tax=Streptomyces zinciresistens K42 TaxID=700597 RepID=G2GIC5_9ACTN|nr:MULTISPECIES: hypothetical protein [Streptomyces]EGX56744.1 hypothetical protein SZN_26326 [Streptomyces zinciresistens K42]MDT9700127.1 hypothetical protein [Streptomyces sp. P17]